MSAQSAYQDVSEQSESCCSLNVRLATLRQPKRACVHAEGRHFEHMM